MPDFTIEKRLIKQGKAIVCGIDEVGRGAWAGPVFVCASIFKAETTIPGVDDSKKLSKEKRNSISSFIKKSALSYAFGKASSLEIDKHGMTKALNLASNRAIQKLSVKPDAIILDGNINYIGDKVFVHLEKKADSKSVTVASSSILAKVHRDNIMSKLHQKHPAYSFHKNSGYGTKEHKEAINKNGLTDTHRKSFNIEGAWATNLAK